MINLANTLKNSNINLEDFELDEDVLVLVLGAWINAGHPRKMVEDVQDKSKTFKGWESLRVSVPVSRQVLGQVLSLGHEK